MASSPDSGKPAAPRAPGSRARRRAVYLLLLLPLIGTLVPPFYNRYSPTIGGMPFFYWYQLAWIPIAMICTWIVYRASRGEKR